MLHSKNAYLSSVSLNSCTALSADAVYMLNSCLPFLNPADLLTFTEIMVARLLSLNKEDILKGRFLVINDDLQI